MVPSTAKGDPFRVDIKASVVRCPKLSGPSRTKYKDQSETKGVIVRKGRWRDIIGGVADYFCIMSWTNSLSGSWRQLGFKQGCNMAPTIDTPVTVLVSFTDHLINFVVSELLANGCHDVSEFGRRDETVVVAVEDLCPSG